MKALEEDITYCCNCGERMLPNTGSQCISCNGQLCSDCTDDSIDECYDCEAEQNKFRNCEGKGF